MIQQIWCCLKWTDLKPQGHVILFLNSHMSGSLEAEHIIGDRERNSLLKERNSLYHSF